jgi:hypothetical protein
MHAASEAPVGIAFGRFLVLPHRRELLADGRPAGQVATTEVTADLGKRRPLSSVRVEQPCAKGRNGRGAIVVLADLTWHRIMEAVTQLANTTPPGLIH